MKSKNKMALEKSTFDFIHSVFFGRPQQACEIGVQSVSHKIYDDVIFISPPRLQDGRKKTDKCQTAQKARREVILNYLRTNGSAFFLRDYDMFGWSYNHMAVTIKSLRSDGLIETFGKKGNGFYANYRLNKLAS